MSIARLPGSDDGVSSGGASASTSIAKYADTAPAPILGDDFPIICESCLGPNPYCRMIKSDMAKECRISGAPFTAFRWQGALRRWKETMVCAAVAREKNVCQACLNDLEYGVPFHVRDSVMDALGEETAPTSDVSSQFHWANKRQRVADGEAGGHDSYEKLQNNVDRLREFAKLNPGPVTWTHRTQPLTPEEQERMRQRRLAVRSPRPPTLSSPCRTRTALWLTLGCGARVDAGAHAARGQVRHLAVHWRRAAEHVEGRAAALLLGVR